MDDQFVSNGAPNGPPNSNSSSHNGINGAPARFPSAPSAQQLQQNSIARRVPDQSQESNTLPPISGLAMPPHQFPPYGNPAGSMPGSIPQTPITPNTPSAPQDPSAFPQPPQQNGVHRVVQPVPQVSMFPNQQGLYSAAPGMPTTLAPNQGYPLMTNLPHRGQPQFHGGILQPQHLAGTRPQEAQPRHVVGQQGRRGVLPAAPNKPAPTIGGKFPIPPKNDEGKFPCPHCTKTYLHAKHLKRHMLRHTGDRPYHCKLCKDTFSRSDILKRHFQKCSIRRGVPGDTDHLEGSRAHNHRGRLSVGTMNEQTHNYIPSTNGAEFTGISHLAHTVPEYLQEQQQHQHLQHLQQQQQQLQQQQQQAYAENMNSMSNRSSRSNSMMHPHMGDATPTFDHRNGFEQQQQANYAPLSTLGGMAPGVQAYSSMAPNSSGYAYSPLNATTGGMNGQQPLPDFTRGGAPINNGQEQNWGSSFPEGFHGFTNPGVNGDGKVEPEASVNSNQDELYSGLYNNSSTSNGNQVFDGWVLGDRIQEKLATLVAFCFTNGAPCDAHEFAIQERLKTILTVENVNHFLGLFMNFQVHWPIFHIPTFSTLQANNGLILTMITIGAIYSDSLGLEEVRWLMEICKLAVDRSFRVFKLAHIVKRESSDGTEFQAPDIEEIQALILLQVIFVWHGNKQQRHNARDEFWKLAAITRHTSLLLPVPFGQPDYSILHQPSRESLTSGDVSAWNWQSWIAQEKRLRCAYLIFLMDSALAIFFNKSPEFDVSEFRIPLPADDASWEATTDLACKEALGLHGPQIQEGVNQSGSRRPRQPEFDKALKLLLSAQVDWAPRSTNIYSKFILIHALHVNIWNLQHKLLSGSHVSGRSSNGPITPLSAYDWVQCQTTPTDGRGTQFPQFPPAHQQQVQTLLFAVEKWKRFWDSDLDLQYPPSGTSPPGIPGVRRIGFCRDAIHFYFMAKQFLRNNNRAFDVQEDPDRRMCFVMKTLKQIRTYVGSESDRQSKELGSVVSMDEDYGVDELNLDMKKLFTPLILERAQHRDVRLQ